MVGNMAYIKVIIYIYISTSNDGYIKLYIYTLCVYIYIYAAITGTALPGTSMYNLNRDFMTCTGSA